MVPGTTVPVGWWRYPLLDNLALTLLMGYWDNVIKTLLQLRVWSEGDE